MAKYQVSPIGELQHPWLNKPDTKFNEKGLYQTDLILGGEDADTLKEVIDTATEVAFAELTDKMLPKDAKKFSRIYPYEIDEDDDGNPTGYIVFKFKQNAELISKGETKKIKIEIRDSEDNPVNVQVFGGSKARIMFSMRGIKVESSKGIGVRLDFAKVQIVELAQGSGGAGFGKVEGGFKGQTQADKSSNGPAPSDEEEAGDY